MLILNNEVIFVKLFFFFRFLLQHLNYLKEMSKGIFIVIIFFYITELSFARFSHSTEPRLSLTYGNTESISKKYLYYMLISTKTPSKIIVDNLNLGEVM